MARVPASALALGFALKVLGLIGCQPGTVPPGTTRPRADASASDAAPATNGGGSGGTVAPGSGGAVTTGTGEPSHPPGTGGAPTTATGGAPASGTGGAPASGTGGASGSPDAAATPPTGTDHWSSCTGVSFKPGISAMDFCTKYASACMFEPGGKTRYKDMADCMARYGSLSDGDKGGKACVAWYLCIAAQGAGLMFCQHAPEAASMSGPCKPSYL